MRGREQVRCTGSEYSLWKTAVQEAKVLVKWEIQNQTDIPHLSFGREVFST